MTVGELVYKVVGDTSQFKQSMDGANKSAGNLKKGVMGLNVGMVALIGAAVAVGKKLFDLAKSAGIYADKMLDLEQVTGISTDNLQRLEFVAAEAGVSFDGLVGSVQRFTARLPQLEEGNSVASRALDELGLSVRDANGELRSGEDIFFDAIGKLSEYENITERNVIAQQLFGRSIADLAPVLGLTAEEFQAALDRGEDFGAILDRDALQAANRFRASLDTLNLVLSKTGNQMGADISPAFEIFTTGLAGSLRVMQVIKEDFGGTFDRIRDQAVDLSGAMSGLNNTMTFGGNVFTTVAAAAKITGFLIEGLFTVVSTNRQLLYTFFDTIMTGARAAIETMDALRGVIQGDVSIGEALEIVKGGAVETWDTFSEGAGAAFENVQSFFNEGIDLVTNFKDDTHELGLEIEAAFKGGSDAAAALIEYNANNMENSLDGIEDAAGDAGDAIVKAFEKPVMDAGPKMVTFLDMFKEKMREVADVGNIVAGGLTDVFGSFSDLQSARTNARLEELDFAMQNELDNAALTSEQREQIEAEYAKKKAKIEYKGKLANWKMDLAAAIFTAPLAIINAMNAGFAAGGPAGIILGPLMAGIAAAATGIQIAAVSAAKPKAPAFQTGGIVPGPARGVDQTMIMADGEEEVLTRDDPRHRYNQGGGQSSGVINLDGNKVGTFFVRFLNDGRGHLKPEVILGT